MARFRIDEISDMLKRLSLIYDLARIVNPELCIVLMAGEDGKIQQQDRCYSYWGKNTRCRHCSSSCAIARAVNEEKEEVREGRIHHILSAPIEVEQKDGTVYPCVMELISSHIRSEDMRVMRDRELMALLTAQLKETHSGVICFNIEEECIYANLELFYLFRVPPGNLHVLKEFFLTWVHDEEISKGKDAPLKANVSWKQKLEIGGGSLDCTVNYHKIFDGSGAFCGYFFEVHDENNTLTKSITSEQPLSVDPLTQLPAREGFYQIVGNILSYALNPDYVLVRSNIKDFKFVNSLFGKDKGDAVLLELGKIFKKHAGRLGVAGRIHGDHFVMLLPRERFDEQEVLRDLNRLTDHFSSATFKLYVHLGVYEVTDISIPVSIMCDRANLALGTISEARSNQIAQYEEELLEKALNDTEILSSFQEAIEKHQFEIFLQPQIRAKDGKLYGAEALVRWRHPKRGLLMPGQFIPLLENAGLIYKMDAYVWGRTAALVSKWQGTPMGDIALSVNISARDAFYIDIYGTILSLTDSLHVPHDKLHLEFTETALMSNRIEYNALIDRLKAKGFVVEIDDFGSGFSSLAMLKDIHADVLKIDLGFLQPSSDNGRTITILKSVIDMARNLGMTSITEGVETREQAQLLRKIGTDAFQGYYFDKPIPIDAFLEKYFSDYRLSDKKDSAKEA